MYMVILILLYDAVGYLQIHNAIGVVGRRLVLVVKSPDETTLDVKDFQAPCPYWPGEEDGGLALTFNVQFHVFDLAWQAVAPFPEFQEIPVFCHREGTEEEASDWGLAGALEDIERSDTYRSNHKQRERQETYQRPRHANNPAGVPGVLQNKFLLVTLINLQFFHCKTGSLIPSQISPSSYKSAVVSRPTCSRSTAI